MLTRVDSTNDPKNGEQLSPMSWSGELPRKLVSRVGPSRVRSIGPVQVFPYHAQHLARALVRFVNLATMTSFPAASFSPRGRSAGSRTRLV